MRHKFKVILSLKVQPVNRLLRKKCQIQTRDVARKIHDQAIFEADLAPIFKNKNPGKASKIKPSGAPAKESMRQDLNLRPLRPESFEGLYTQIPVIS